MTLRKLRSKIKRTILRNKKPNPGLNLEPLEQRLLLDAEFAVSAIGGGDFFPDGPITNGSTLEFTAPYNGPLMTQSFELANVGDDEVGIFWWFAITPAFSFSLPQTPDTFLDDGESTTFRYEFDPNQLDISTIVANFLDEGTESLQVLAADPFTFTVQAFVNADPTVDAGDDQAVNEGDTINFTGIFTDLNDRGLDPVTFLWDFGDGNNSADQNPTHVYGDDGIYEVSFTVTDDHGGSDTDTMIVSVFNVAPTADAGGPYVVNEGFGGTLQLNGSATDPSGMDAEGLSYAWDLDGDGNFGEANEPANGTLSWSNLTALGLPSDGTPSTIWLKVTDDDGGVGLAHTTLTINNLDPFAGTGGPYVINEGEDLPLDAGMLDEPGEFSVLDDPVGGSWDPDPRDVLTYSWDLDNDGDYEIINHPYPTYTVPWPMLEALGLASDGTQLTIGLRVDDGEGGSDTAEGSLTINNLAPTADIFTLPEIGALLVLEGEDVLLRGRGSRDPGNDPLTYSWGVLGFDIPFGEQGDLLKMSWPLIELISGCLEDDVIPITLIVTEAVGAEPLSDETTVPIYIINVHPTADAGGAYTINEGEDLGLDGSASSDPNANDELLYFWDVNNNGDFFDDNIVGVNPIVPWSVLEPLMLASDGSILEIPLLVLDEEPEIPDEDGPVTNNDDPDGITRNYDIDTAYLAINNLAAAVDAGGPYVVNEAFGGAIQFNGSATDPDGNDELTFAWDLNNDGIFGGANEPTGLNPNTTTWNNLVALGLPSDGSARTIWLRADDGEDGVGYAHTTLTIKNLNPNANAGGPYTINEGQGLLLNGNGSSDPDSRDVLTYAWDLDNDGDYEFTADPTGMRSVPWSTLETMALASNGTALTIGLRVEDNHGGVDTDTATFIIKNVNPTADANGDYIIDEGEDLVLDAAATTDPDANDVLTFEWDLDNDGEFDDAAGINLTVDWAAVEALGLPSNGTEITIAVRVTDSDGGVNFANAALFINNVNPTADAGGPYTIVEGQGLEGADRLDASGSTDPDANDVLSYAWDLDNDGLFDDAFGVTAEVPWSTLHALGLDSDGTSLVINLQVTDSDGGVDTDKALLLVVANDAPNANAGGPYLINEGQNLTLNASASTDPGQDLLSYLWDLDDDGVYNDAAGVTPVVPWAKLEKLGLASNGAVLTIGVRVDDGEEGGVGFASTTLIINNVNPTADADGPYVINEGQKLTLDAGGTTDPDANDVLTFAWELDNDGQFDDALGVNPTLDWAVVEALALASNGTALPIAVRVIDSDGGVDVDNTTLTINNVNPTAFADGPRTILEGGSLTLDASASTDPDANDVLTFAWDLDNDGFFDDAFGPKPFISWSLIESLHLATDGSPLTIEVLVVDSDGGSDTDTTELMITNVAPTVDAGDDFVNLMGEEAFFDGSFFDPAGILDTHTYLWDFGDGHTATTLDATHIYTYSGYYTASLTITDSDGAQTIDYAEITVEEEIEVIDNKAFYHNISGTIVVTLFGPGSMRIFHINESGIDFNRIELTDTTDESRLIFRPEEFHPHFVIGDILVSSSQGDYQPETLIAAPDGNGEGEGDDDSDGDSDPHIYPDLGDNPAIGSLGKIKANKGTLEGSILVPGSLLDVRLDKINENGSIQTGDGPLEKVNVKFDIEGTLESGAYIKKVVSRTGGLTSTGAIIALDGNIDTAKFADDVAGALNASADVGKVLSLQSTLSGTIRAGVKIGKVRFDNIDSALISSGGDIDLIFSRTSIAETIMLAGSDIGADLIPDSGDDFFNADGAEIAKIKVHPKEGDFFNSSALAGVRPFDYNPITETWTILAPAGQTQQVASFGSIGNATVGQVFLNGDSNVGTYGLFAATNVAKVKFVEVAGAGAPDFEIIGTW